MQWGSGTVLGLYDFAMGANRLPDSPACNLCDFLTYFMLALTDFSEACYAYFHAWFGGLAPTLVAIWIGFRVAKLMMTGGENGREVIWSVIQKLALLLFVWLVMNPPGATEKWAWSLIGPTTLSYTFELSNDVHERTAAALPNATVPDCTGPNSSGVKNALTGKDSLVQEFIGNATETGCFIERIHVMGISTGLGIAISFPEGGGGIWQIATSFGQIILRVMIGAFLCVVWAISLVWFLFLILDVVIRMMITAAFAPLLALAYLFDVSRNVATGSIRSLIGSMVTAVAIGIVGTLTLAIVNNTVDVYNSTYPSKLEAYGNDTRLTALPTGSEGFRTFLARTMTSSDPGTPTIPQDLTAPWTLYLIMSGLVSYALGKKLIGMIQSAIGTQNESTFADNAVKQLKTGAAGAFVAGGATMYALGGASRGVGSLAALGAGGATSGWKRGLGVAGAGFGGAGRAMQLSNPFANSEQGAKNAAGAAASGMGKATMLGASLAAGASGGLATGAEGDKA